MVRRRSCHSWTPHPFAVLCEAAAQANGMPFEFLVDTIAAATHSHLHKDFHVCLGQYESKNRYWFVGMYFGLLLRCCFRFGDIF